MQSSSAIFRCQEDIQLNLLHLTSTVSSSVQSIASRVSRFIKENWSRILYYTALSASLVLHTKTFLLGTAWGVFLECLDTVSSEEAKTPSLPSLYPESKDGSIKQDSQCQERQFLGGAGMLITGTLLFGPLASFTAGWSSAEGTLSYLHGRAGVL